MSGNKYLLDTNAIVSLFNGNPSILNITGNASWMGISIISVLEFLAFSGLSQSDKTLFLGFIKNVEVVNLSANNQRLIDEVCSIRKQFKLKLPDAIIAASAITNNCDLLTNDTDFKKIQSLSIISF
jgi:predicted nucleic acid-binding protein